MNIPSTKPNRILLLVAGVAILAMGDWGWSQYSQVSSLQKENDALKARLAKVEQRAKSDSSALAFQRTPTPRNDPPAATTDTHPADAANSAGKRNLNPEEIATMIKNPAMQSIINSQQGVLKQMAYRDLMDKLKLSPAERDYMQNLLVAKQMDKINIGMELVNPALSPDEKAAVVQQFRQAQQTDEANVHAFLNDDADFATYQAYSQHEPEHTEVGMVETALANGSEPLDSNSADALVNLLDATRQNFQFTVDFNNESNYGNPALLTGGNVNKFLDEEAQFQAQVADKAAQLLTPVQLNAFKQNQAAMMQMTKQKMNSILQMAGAANP